MRRLVPVLALGFVALATARCALVSGLDGLDVGNPATTDASVDASLDVDADADAKPAADAIADTPPDIAPPDGGCNCIPIPSGWTAIRFASTGTNTPCPIGDTAADVLLSPVTTTASGSCACTCTTTVDCTNPNAEFFGSASCANVAGAAKVMTSGACLPFPVPPNGLDGIRVAPVVATCKTTPPTFPPTSSGTGRRCIPPPTSCGTGLGCDGATGPFAACIAHDGDVACPSDHPTKTSIGSSVTDGRVCNGCGCNVTNPTCTYDLKSFKNAACTQQDDVATGISGVCASFIGAPYYTATVKTSATCTATGGTASGSTAVVGAQTVCCK